MPLKKSFIYLYFDLYSISLFLYFIVFKLYFFIFTFNGMVRLKVQYDTKFNKLAMSFI